MLIAIGPRRHNYANRLVIRTPGKPVDDAAHWKAKVWAPRQTRSYTLRNLTHTDEHDNAVACQTGYAWFDVFYYTTEDEGEIEFNPKTTGEGTEARSHIVGPYPTHEEVLS